MAKTFQEMSVLEVYDILYADAKRLGREKEIIAEFGNREEYAKKAGEKA